jgi:hypothetical protein
VARDKYSSYLASPHNYRFVRGTINLPRSALIHALPHHLHTTLGVPPSHNSIPSEIHGYLAPLDYITRLSQKRSLEIFSFFLFFPCPERGATRRLGTAVKDPFHLPSVLHAPGGELGGLLFPITARAIIIHVAVLQQSNGEANRLSNLFPKAWSKGPQ